VATRVVWDAGGHPWLGGKGGAAQYAVRLRRLVTKPVIAISVPEETREDGVRQWVRDAYVDAVEMAGAMAVLLPNRLTSVPALARCDGLLLTGGGDFDPAWYGQPPRAALRAVSARRDATEVALVHRANRWGMPILGICRGIQAIAVATGGTLIHDLSRHGHDPSVQHDQTEPRQLATHRVVVEPGSHVARAMGTVAWVNSFHHQAVDQVPPGWSVSARADDGVIEAIETLGERFAVGVQWHPEDLAAADPGTRALWEAFVKACEQYGQQRQWPISGGDTGV
jgi:putative glutamine amidotransferase